MTILRIISVVPYTLYLFAILAPAAALSYALASFARAVWEGLKSGWREHEPPKGA